MAAMMTRNAVLLPDALHHDHNGKMFPFLSLGHLHHAYVFLSHDQAPFPMLKDPYPLLKVSLPMLKVPLFMLQTSYTMHKVSFAFVRTKIIKRGQRGQQRTIRRGKKTPQH